MRISISIGFIICVCAITTTSFATDVINGNKLYDLKCRECHDSRIFTRPNRIVHTYEALVSRVEFCNNQVKAGFTNSEQSDVTDYLNENFFKFIKISDVGN